MPSVAATALLREAVERETSVARAGLPNRFRRAAHQMAERDQLVAPAFRFAIVDLERPAAATLHAGGMILHAPRLLPAAGELTALACGVATIGARLEQRVTALCAERSVSLALALDALGNHCLHVLSRRLQDRMLAAARNRGLVLAGELRPGDPGLALDAQPTVLGLADADAIGVTVTRGCLLHPLKSISMVLGAGLGLPPAHWSRCDDCRSRPTCKFIARAAERAPA
ncbi:MAG: hypothetical protein ACXW3S_16470 [Rhodoplanes sp.]